MFASQSLVILLLFASDFWSTAQALPQVEQSDYIDQLKSHLIDQNLTTLEAGQYLVNSLPLDQSAYLTLVESAVDSHQRNRKDGRWSLFPRFILL